MVKLFLMAGNITVSLPISAFVLPRPRPGSAVRAADWASRACLASALSTVGHFSKDVAFLARAKGKGQAGRKPALPAIGFGKELIDI